MVGLVVPTGYSFNPDGTSIYLTMAAVFGASRPLTATWMSSIQITLLVVLLLSLQKGAAGVTGKADFIIMAAAFSAVGAICRWRAQPLILGIDRRLSG